MKRRLALVKVCEKSPCFCSAVGTDPSDGDGPVDRIRSRANMKKVRSRPLYNFGIVMGPSNSNPY